MKPIMMITAVLSIGVAAIASTNIIYSNVEEAPLSLCIRGTNAAIPCSMDDPKSNLAGTQWLIKMINDESAIAGFGTPSLGFGEGTIGVSTGCRPFGAKVLDAASPIRFQIIQAPIIAIACSQNLEDQEIALGGVIATTTDVRVDDTGRLILSSPDGHSLVAVPKPEGAVRN